ncbi:hypothetical protein PDESU_03799 [Pontiella desulfatans]|uniref:Uncharacterized protein n=1 Tax=Pontiella desulfatans TaxID=2750659 RepID=A0A6C2U5Z0_PONDE|nr:hypothetical protein [Pontiella desulfatans]VGO15217.1 hypothetical protein PDESU_03799 [Pontiella desulfatans]
MKTEFEWKNLARRGVLAAATACSALLLIGCGDDDGDNGGGEESTVPTYAWRLTFTTESGTVQDPIELELPWQNSSEFENGANYRSGNFEIYLLFAGSFLDITLTANDEEYAMIATVNGASTSIAGTFDYSTLSQFPPDAYSGTFVIERI